MTNVESFTETPTGLANFSLKRQHSAPSVFEMLLCVTMISPYFVCNPSIIFYEQFVVNIHPELGTKTDHTVRISTPNYVQLQTHAQ